jgi:hypothetical protein
MDVQQSVGQRSADVAASRSALAAPETLTADAADGSTRRIKE